MSAQLLTELDSFNFDKIDGDHLIINGCFRIKRKKKYYLVTGHSFYPIKNVYLEEEKLKICINCIWNEFLILKEENPLENIKNYKNILTFDSFATKLPNIGSSVFIDGIKCQIKDFTFIDLGHISEYPQEVYIQIEIKNAKSFKVGTPIYSNSTSKKFQGMVSLHDYHHIYCVPSYYLLKTFQKENTFKIPDLNFPIEKINRHIIKDNFIFSPFLGINVPVSSFLFLENDRSLELYNKKDDFEFLDLKNLDKKKTDSVLNKRRLVCQDEFYQLSLCSLHLLKRIFPKFLEEINIEILNKNFNIQFKIENDMLLIK